MNILFVCTGNTCRSPMAAAIMNRLSKDKNLDIHADSAGILAQEALGASENAIISLQDYNIDLSNHQSKPLSDDLINKSDLILTMTNAHKQLLLPISKDNIFTLNEYAHLDGDIPDPYGGSLSEYKDTAHHIYNAIEKIIEGLKK